MLWTGGFCVLSTTGGLLVFGLSETLFVVTGGGVVVSVLFVGATGAVGVFEFWEER